MGKMVLRACFAGAMAISLAACGKWYDKDGASATAPSVLSAIQLSPASASIPANGFSTVLVTATITADATLAKRTVHFTTTGGTFVGSGTPETNTMDRTADGNNVATVELRSARSIGTARVTASVVDVAGLVSNESLVTFTTPVPGDEIRIIAASTAPADGASITQVIADIAGALPAGRRTVTFSTTMGKFVGTPGSSEEGKSEISADADGGNRAIAYLRSPGDVIGTAFLTAKVDSLPSVSAQASVQIQRAAPNRVLVTTDSPTIPQDFTTKVRVTVTLVRDIGIPTKDTIVTFRAVDSGGVERGLFTNVTRSNAAGVATADFVAGTFAALGDMGIIATAEGVSGSAKIRVQ